MASIDQGYKNSKRSKYFFPNHNSLTPVFLLKQVKFPAPDARVETGLLNQHSLKSHFVMTVYTEKCQKNAGDNISRLA